MEVTNKLVKGGEFIIKETDAQDVFTPADFSEEQNMMHQTALDFVEKEVQPLLERLDNHDTYSLGAKAMSNPLIPG